MAILTEGAGNVNMASATTPKQAVQEPSALSGLANFAQGAVNVFETRSRADAAQARTQAIADKEAQALAGEQQDTLLSRELLKVSHLYDQTGNSKEAVRMSKLALTRALANPANAGRGDDLVASYTKFMAVAGLGKDFFETSEVERVRALQMDAAAKNGVQFRETDSEEVIQGKLDNHTAYVREMEALKQATSELAYTNAQLTRKGKLSANELSEINLKEKKAKIASAKSLKGMADAQQTILLDNFSNIREVFDQSGDGTQALFAVEHAYAGIRQIIASTAGTGNEALVTALTAPMRNLYEANIRYIKGTDTKEMLENAQKIEQMRAVQLLYVQDPQLQQYVAASNMVGNMDPSLTGEVNARTTIALEKINNAKPFDFANAEPEVQKATLATALSFIEKDTAGGLDGATRKEGLTTITNLFSGMDKYAASVDNPEQLNELMSFLSDPRFGEWAKANKGIPASISAQVKETLKAYYSEPVLKDVVQNWEMDVTIDQKTFGFSPFDTLTEDVRENRFNKPRTPIAALPDVLEPYMTESGLSFRGKEGAPQNLVPSALKQVQKTVLPKINRLVKAMAHVEGHTDYNRIYEENYARVLGIEPEEETVTKPKEPLDSETFVPLEGDTIESGAVVGGYRFNGGDTSDPANWSKVNG